MADIPSFGSGTAILNAGMQGGTDALKASLMSRGINPSILQKLSPSAPGFNPGISAPQSMSNIAPPPVPKPVGTPTPPPQMNTPQPTPAPTPSQQQGQTMLANSPESELIIRALSQRLSSLSKAGI